MAKSFNAILKEKDIIEVAVYKSYTSNTIESFKLYENNKFIKKLAIISKSESNSTFIYTLSVDYDFKIGCEYAIADDRLEKNPLKISLSSMDKDYEKKYRFDGKLGAIYSKEETIFRLFSPLATSVFVNIISREGKNFLVAMERKDSGVYEAIVKNDLDYAKYTYIAKINGTYVEACDPYSFSVSSNSNYSYVVDLEKVKDYKNDIKDNRPRLERITDALIYEISVRDMTSLTEIENRAKFSGLSKTGLTTKDNYPIGMDYIKKLGVNYVQLMPIYDFQTIDDENQFDCYNWGYDPKFYFVPEGSYASDPDDPYCRLYELKEMISSFHENGIGVIMDVVFNHVFNVESNALNVLCPGYYFRLNSDGTYSSGSGCGNDLETRNYMTRKLIIDAISHFIEVFSIDGFRFDLMGIIDVETMNLAYQKAKELNDNIIFYGEGWDLYTNLPADQKSSMFNADKIKPIGFFNDRFRDIVKGKSCDSELANRGYLTGDKDYIDGFKNVFLGSSITLAFPPLFSSPAQSINYVECHDNATLFDKLKFSNANLEEKDRLKIIKLINSVNVLAFGIPFIHAGQEFGATKNGVTNSYNASDKINGFNYELANSRNDMVRYFIDVIKLKKSLPFLAMDDKKELIEHVSFNNIDGGGLAVIYRFDEADYYLLINPSENTLSYQFSDYVKVIFNEAGLMDDNHYAKLIMINKFSLVMIKYSK